MKSKGPSTGFKQHTTQVHNLERSVKSIHLQQYINIELVNSHGVDMNKNSDGQIILCLKEKKKLSRF